MTYKLNILYLFTQQEITLVRDGSEREESYKKIQLQRNYIHIKL